jgi:hypothetical protein
MDRFFNLPILRTRESTCETPLRDSPCLATHKLTDVSNVVREVQEILNCLVIEMDHRLTGYKVDPGGKLREALAGANTVPQLEHAWSFLTNRLFEGGKRVDKYYREDRMEIVNSPRSPRSTDPGFFDEGFLSGTVEDTLCKHLMPMERARIAGQASPRQTCDVGLPSTLKPDPPIEVPSSRSRNYSPCLHV